MSLIAHDTCSAQDTSFSTVLPNAAMSTNPHLKKHKNMKNSPASNLSIVALACVLLVAAGAPTSAQNLTNGLVAYWPLDQVQGDKTPDLVNGYDMQLNNLSAADLVDGIRGKCFSFSNQNKTLLSRVHGANDELPINKHAAFTVSLWTKSMAPGRATCECSPKEHVEQRSAL
jgi:hypothetical protein